MIMISRWAGTGSLSSRRARTCDPELPAWLDSHHIVWKEVKMMRWLGHGGNRTRRLGFGCAMTWRESMFRMREKPSRTTCQYKWGDDRSRPTEWHWPLPGRLRWPPCCGPKLKKTNEDPSKRSEGKQIRVGWYWEYLSKTDKVLENDTNGWRELIGRHKEQGWWEQVVMNT